VSASHGVLSSQQPYQRDSVTWVVYSRNTRTHWICDSCK